MTGWHLAQFNVARCLFPLEDPRMAGFTGRLAEINALGDTAPGFVWRLQGEGGTSSELQFTRDPMIIVNLTAWASVDELWAYTYQSEHRTLFAERNGWFERLDGPSLVMWWIPVGDIPTAQEGFVRLARLKAEGPTQEAFTFKHRFDPPG